MQDGRTEVPSRPRTGVDDCKAPNRDATARSRSLPIHHVVCAGSAAAATQAAVK